MAYNVRFTTSSGHNDFLNVNFLPTTGYAKFSTLDDPSPSMELGILNIYSNADDDIEQELLTDFQLSVGTLTNQQELHSQDHYTSDGFTNSNLTLTKNITDISELFIDTDAAPGVLIAQSYTILNNKQIWFTDANDTLRNTGATITFTAIAGRNPISPACFIEGTKLYAHVHDKDLYVNIKDLRSGDLINTYLHGKKAIKFIGKGTMTNDPTKWNGCVKKLPKHGDMTDDLFVTGAHSILVDELSEKEKEGMLAIYGTADRKVDDKILLLSWVSDKFESIVDEENYTYYHLVLEHDNDEMKRYGIWANGVLTESQCEKHFLTKPYKLL